MFSGKLQRNVNQLIVRVACLCLL